MEKPNYFNPSLSQRTFIQYQSNLHRLEGLLEKNVADASQDMIIETLTGWISNPNSMASLLNIAIIVFRWHEKNVDKLIKFRDVLKTEIKSLRLEENKTLKDTLPTYEEIDTWIKGLVNREQYKAYIINYLTFYLSTRNEDIYIKFVKTRKEAAKDLTMNYLIVQPKKVIYVRNVYKTAVHYGQKIDVITDKDFRKSILKLRNRQDYLIENKHKNPVPPVSIGSYVMGNTYKNIGEGKYLKVRIADAQTEPDTFSLVKQISHDRGTDLHVLLSAYNISDK